MNLAPWTFAMLSLACLPGRSQDAWAPPGPFPVGSIPLKSMHFTDARTGYVVDDSGNINATRDGGSSWTATPGMVSHMNSIHFPSAATGYIGGQRIILKTGDRGSRWTRLELGVTTKSGLASIHFTSEDTGFALTGQSEVLKTTDGGGHWTKSEFVLNRPLKIYFFGSRLGFAMGASTAGNESFVRLQRTTDGGATWTGIGCPFIFESMHFIDADTGFAAGFTYIPYVDGKLAWSGRTELSGSVYRTTDGGLTWAPLFPPKATAFQALCMAGRKQAFAAAFDFTRRVGSLYRSDDGGATWSLQWEKPEYLVRNLQCPDSSLSFALGYYYIGVGAQPPYSPLFLRRGAASVGIRPQDKRRVPRPDRGGSRRGLELLGPDRVREAFFDAKGRVFPASSN